MPLTLDFLAHLLAFDVAWVVAFILGNLHWLFAFVATAYFFSGSKRVVGYFLILVMLVWSVFDLTSLMSWTVLAGGFLMLMYISRVAVLTYANDIPYLKTKIVIVMTIQMWIVVVLYNVFLV